MTWPATSPIRLLPWDTEFFGLRIAAVNAAPLETGAIARLVEEAREQRVDCVYLLSDAADVGRVQAAEQVGFRFVDIRLTLACAPEARSASQPSADRVRAAREADVPALRSLAALSHTASRFFADRRFPRDRAAALYSTWIEKSVRGWSDLVLTVDDDGIPAGYLSCHLRAEESGEIGLVAVSQQAQGKGFGGELLDAGMSWFAAHGVERVSVVTQGANLAALRLYQSRGFLTSCVQLWHHFWIENEP